METTIAHLFEFIAGLHPVLQFLAVFAIGVVPYLESHVGAFVGTLTGIPVVLAALAALAAIAGNLLALAVATRAGGAVQRRVAARRGSPSKRSQKVLAKVDQFGVPVASLLGPFVLATALSTFIMISTGLDRRTVITWQSIAVVVWGIVFAGLGLGALAALT
jgi:hypothetical protein